MERYGFCQTIFVQDTLRKLLLYDQTRLQNQWKKESLYYYNDTEFCIPQCYVQFNLYECFPTFYLSVVPLLTN